MSVLENMLEVNVSAVADAQAAGETAGIIGIPNGLITISLLLMLVYTIRDKGQKSPLDLLPGPRPWPILGNLPQMGNKPYETLTNLSKTYGDVYRIYFGSTPIVVISGHETIRGALVQQWNAFSSRPNFHSFQFIAEGKSIAFRSPSDDWKMHRRATVSALGNLIKSDKESMELFTRKAIIRLASNLKEASAGVTPVDPIYNVELINASIFFRICFGFEKEEGESQKVIMKTLKTFDGLFQKLGAIDFMPWLKPLLKGASKDMLATMTSFSEQIDALLVGSERGQNNLASILDKNWEDSPALASTGITRRQLLHSTEDVIGAGTENTTNFLNWSIVYMAKFPEIQAAVYAEVESVAGCDGEMEWSHRQQMPLTESTIWEICRHSNMSPSTLPHAATEDTVLHGYLIPKGTACIGNIHSLMHDPQIFPEPSEFRPSRFISGGRVNQELVTRLGMFGMGKRRCLGERYAQKHMFVTLATLLQQCKITEPQGAPVTLDGSFTVTNKPNPFQVVFSPRM